MKSKLLLAIVILALGMRLYGVTNNPPALNWDEVSHGYNAYSILKTGKDEWGKSIPLIFRAYGDYKLPGYIYLTSLSVGVFGLNAFSVRLVSIVAGTLLVIYTYLLAHELFGKARVALVAALLVAVEPWSLFLSRGAFEANLAVAMFVMGVFYVLHGLKKMNYVVVVGMLFLGLSVWTYNTYRVFVPLMLVAGGYIYRSEIFRLRKKKQGVFVLTAFVGLLMFGSMIWQLASSEGQARFGWVSIIDQGAISEINANRASSELGSTLDRLRYNKLTYFVPRFSANYFSHFDPRFLFLEGGDHYQFNVQGHGLLYPLSGLMMLFGLVYLTKVRSKSELLLVGWILFAPIASSMTREAPHALRYAALMPVPMILAGLGLVDVVKAKKRGFVMYGLFGLITLAFMLSYGYRYFGEYRENYSQSWQYGYKEVVEYVAENHENYDKIVMTKRYGEPHEFVLFYTQWDPDGFRREENLVRFFQSNWYWVDRIGKYSFVNDWQVLEGANEERFLLESGIETDCRESKCLLVASPDYMIENWKRKHEVRFLDKEEAFLIYENK